MQKSVESVYPLGSSHFKFLAQTAVQAHLDKGSSMEPNFWGSGMIFQLNLLNNIKWRTHLAKSSTLATTKKKAHPTAFNLARPVVNFHPTSSTYQMLRSDQHKNSNFHQSKDWTNSHMSFYVRCIFQQNSF